MQKMRVMYLQLALFTTFLTNIWQVVLLALLQTLFSMNLSVNIALLLHTWFSMIFSMFFFT